MRTFKMIALGGTLALAVAATTGCSTVQKGAAGGGALGAGIGAIVGHNSAQMTIAQGAAIGGGAGAATGGLAGDAYDQMNEKDIEREIENLRAELASKDAELAGLRNQGPSTEQLAELDRLKGELDAVRAQLDAANNDLASARGAASKNDGELSNLRSQLNEKDAKLTGLNSQLSAAQAERDKALAQAGDLSNQLRDANNQLAKTRSDMDTIQASLREKGEALDKMKNELAEMNVQLEETSRGITLTIVDQLLFTPGKAELSKDGQELISKVAAIIEKNFPGRELLVEGHTDNEPIKRSGWKSNWELGSARALSVLHELIEAHNFDPAKMSATTFGEFRPSTPNATDSGRAANRRSVIVILPEKLPLQRNTLAGL